MPSKRPSKRAPAQARRNVVPSERLPLNKRRSALTSCDSVRRLPRPTPTARWPYLLHQVSQSAEGRQQFVSLGSQGVIVLVDARDHGSELVQAPELGAKPLVLLGPFGQQAVSLLVIEAEEPADLRGYVLDVLGAPWVLISGHSFRYVASLPPRSAARGWLTRYASQPTCLRCSTRKLAKPIDTSRPHRGQGYVGNGWPCSSGRMPLLQRIALDWGRYLRSRHLAI